MKICVITEWDNFKDSEKMKAYYDQSKKVQSFTEKLNKELGTDRSTWTDGSGHVVWIVEYPSAEAYAKESSNEEYQKLMVNVFRRVQNVSIRVLRPASYIPIE